MTRGDCESIRPLISAALDGELDEDEFVRLSEHLASCPDCHQAYQDYSQLRDELRTASTPVPPSHLTRSIRKETVEKPPPPLVVQFMSRAGLKFGATTVAASLVILFALGIFGYLGYDRQSAPAVERSTPAQEVESIQDWPVRQPVEIEFSKPMDQASVKRNLIIRPSTESDRLPRHWDDNTLVIGRSESQSVLLKPRTDYTIAILGTAEDRHGNPLGEDWVLRFRTSPEEVAVNTPPEDDRDEAQQTPTQTREESSPSPSPEETPTRSGDNGSGEDNDRVGGEDVAESDVKSDQPDPTSTPPAPDPRDQPVDDESTEPASNQEQNQGQEQGEQDQQDQSQRKPEPTATPKPTATPSPTPEPAATATPKPEPTPTPTTSATAAEESTSTPETIPVRGAFGEVYWGNQAVQDQLGQPMQEAQSFIAAEQEFQRGLMFRRFHRVENAIFVFVNGGKVLTRNFNYDPETDDYPGEDLGNGLYAPSEYFGKVWSVDSDIAESLGNAVSLNANENIDGAIQQFTNGQMIYSRGMVYVIYQDWTWEAYPAQSGDSGGFQNEEDGEDQSQQEGDEQPDGGTGGDSNPESDDATESEFQSTPDEETTSASPEQQDPAQDEEQQAP